MDDEHPRPRGEPGPHSAPPSQEANLLPAADLTLHSASATQGKEPSAEGLARSASTTETAGASAPVEDAAAGFAGRERLAARGGGARRQRDEAALADAA